MKLVVCGCSGCMGRMVVKAAEKNEDIEVVGGIDLEKCTEFGFPVVDSAENLTVKPDVIIDFSNPRALTSLLSYAKNNKIPLVLCTTGLDETQVEQIKENSRIIPIFFSGNMSLGINILLKLVKEAAAVLKNDFDIEIIEKHHNRKIDAPSGTAFMLADEISATLKNQVWYSYDRHSRRKPRDKNEIGIHSIRGGNIVGDHEVIFAGKNEVITLSHHAQSREIFADGAIKAARFLCDKGAGLYCMDDILG